MISLEGLRICLVGPVPPPAGGMAMQTRQLAELLRSADAEVTLVPTNSPYRPAWAGRLRGIRALFRLIPYLVRLWRTAGRCHVVHVMANSGWSWHLFAAPAVWIAATRKVPVVVNYRGGEAADFLARSAGLVRMTMRRAASLVVPSGFLQEIFGAHHLPSRIIPNIVDSARFHPGAELPQGCQILVARNLEPIYENATALRAFAKVLPVRPDARLVIAGTGPQAQHLRQLAADLGVADKVTFAGRMERDEMAACLRRSRVALNPSRVDNMPNSVLEALASGVPVVSTNVGGVPHIVRDGETAVLVPVGDTDAMAAAILRALNDAPLADRLRSAGLASAGAYTWAAVAPRWCALYRDLAGKAHAS